MSTMNGRSWTGWPSKLTLATYRPAATIGTMKPIVTVTPTRPSTGAAAGLRAAVPASRKGVGLVRRLDRDLERSCLLRLVRKDPHHHVRLLPPLVLVA